MDKNIPKEKKIKEEEEVEEEEEKHRKHKDTHIRLPVAHNWCVCLVVWLMWSGVENGGIPLKKGSNHIDYGLRVCCSVHSEGCAGTSSSKKKKNVTKG